MPGDEWQRHATLRALYGYMFVHPGKKLLFMGGEIGQWREWNHDGELDWELLGDPRHAGMQRWVRDLNRHYASEPSLWEQDYDAARLLVDRLPRTSRTASSRSSAAAADRRRCERRRRQFHADASATTTGSACREAARGSKRLNSDAAAYGGSNVGNQGQVIAEDHSVARLRPVAPLTVPPLGFVLFHRERVDNRGAVGGTCKRRRRAQL